MKRKIRAIAPLAQQMNGLIARYANDPDSTKEELIKVFIQLNEKLDDLINDPN